MSGPFSSPPSVLIIDDDPHLLAAYTVLLEEEFQVYTAQPGRQSWPTSNGSRLICSSSVFSSRRSMASRCSGA